MIEQKKYPAGPDMHQGAGIRRTENITHSTGTVNRYIDFCERMRLAKCLAYGRLLTFKFPFINPRHKVIYSHLGSFLHNYPSDQYQSEYFVNYLAETGALKSCGGPGCVRGIFGDAK
jgi:hypothetical protein